MPSNLAARPNVLKHPIQFEENSLFFAFLNKQVLLGFKEGANKLAVCSEAIYHLASYSPNKQPLLIVLQAGRHTAVPSGAMKSLLYKQCNCA